LTTPQSFTVGSGPEVAAPRDVNGDGRPDLVVTNGENFSVLLNTTPPGAATLSFAPQQVFEAGRGPRLPVLEDINGDGRPDLVLANDAFDEHAVSVFFNTTPSGSSTVSFGPRQYFEFFAPGFVLAADVNGDGRPDLIVSRAMQGIRNSAYRRRPHSPAAQHLQPLTDFPNRMSHRNRS
jgi:FG-GAP-like repeat/FG-GAP repeat